MREQIDADRKSKRPSRIQYSLVEARERIRQLKNAGRKRKVVDLELPESIWCAETHQSGKATSPESTAAKLLSNSRKKSTSPQKRLEDKQISNFLPSSRKLEAGLPFGWLVAGSMSLVDLWIENQSNSKPKLDESIWMASKAQGPRQKPRIKRFEELRVIEMIRESWLLLPVNSTPKNQTKYQTSPSRWRESGRFPRSHQFLKKNPSWREGYFPLLSDLLTYDEKFGVTIEKLLDEHMESLCWSRPRPQPLQRFQPPSGFPPEQSPIFFVLAHFEKFKSRQSSAFSNGHCRHGKSSNYDVWKVIPDDSIFISWTMVLHTSLAEFSGIFRPGGPNGCDFSHLRKKTEKIYQGAGKKNSPFPRVSVGVLFEGEKGRNR